MKSYAGYLRQARDEVSPQIPQLAPHLIEEPTIILDALKDSLQQQDVDPDAISPYDLGKTERHTLVSFAINEQRGFAVTGEGAEAQLRDLRPVKLPLGIVGDRGTYFKRRIRKAQAGARDKVALHYSYGDNPEHRWWPLAKERYTTLVRETDEPRFGKIIPLEARSLRRAMTSSALGVATLTLAKIVKKNLKAPSEERIKAAHDLTHILASLASLNLMQSRSFNPDLPVMTLEKDDNWTYWPIYDEDNRGWIKKSLPDVTLLTATLKCPAHTDPLPPHYGPCQSPDSAESVEPSESPNDPPQPTREDTNLEIMAHAAINAGGVIGIFDTYQPSLLRRFADYMDY